MQKKLIALAVAGLVSGSAFAQSNVTIYGVMDTTWESYKASGATTSGNDITSHTRLANNSSYVGFKGAESLGNGLTAVFQFETGINSDTGAWSTSGRDTLVGLAGGFGTIAAGNLSGPVRQIGAAVEFSPGATTAGATASMYGEVLGVHTGVDDRSRNTVAYISPTFGGFYGVVAYQNGTPASDASTVDKKSKLWTLGLVYANGPIFAGFGYIDAKRPDVASAFGGTAGDEDKLKNYRFSGKYSFPSGTTIAGLYDVQKYDMTAAATGANTDAKRKAYMLGVNQNFGANNIWLQYAVAKDLTGNICNAVSCGDTDAKQITLGYSYSMSKRTMLHAFYSTVRNAAGATYDHYVNPVGIATASAGADTKVWGGGLRHTF